MRMLPQTSMCLQAGRIVARTAAQSSDLKVAATCFLSGSTCEGPLV
jgi:hypothetical protein